VNIVERYILFFFGLKVVTINKEKIKMTSDEKRQDGEETIKVLTKKSVVEENTNLNPAPDGGYGWVVLVASFVSIIILIYSFIFFF